MPTHPVAPRLPRWQGTLPIVLLALLAFLLAEPSRVLAHGQEGGLAGDLGGNFTAGSLQKLAVPVGPEQGSALVELRLAEATNPFTTLTEGTAVAYQRVPITQGFILMDYAFPEAGRYLMDITFEEASFPSEHKTIEVAGSSWPWRFVFLAGSLGFLASLGLLILKKRWGRGTGYSLALFTLAGALLLGLPTGYSALAQPQAPHTVNGSLRMEGQPDTRSTAKFTVFLERRSGPDYALGPLLMVRRADDNQIVYNVPLQTDDRGGAEVALLLQEAGGYEVSLKPWNYLPNPLPEETFSFPPSQIVWVNEAPVVLKSLWHPLAALTAFFLGFLLGAALIGAPSWRRKIK